MSRMLALFLCCLLFAKDFALAEDGLPKEPPRLQRGVNLNLWFRYVPSNISLEHHVAQHFQEADFALLQRLRIDHVRLNLHPSVVIKIHDGHALVRDEAKGLLKNAVERLIAIDRAVILDLHAEVNQGPEDLEHSMLSSAAGPSGEAQFLEFWEDMARLMSHLPGEKLVFELLNEPVFADSPARWEQLQKQGAERIWAIIPTANILMSGAHWGGIDSLVRVEPIIDPRVRYSFHYYEPFLFTHQGAGWTKPNLTSLKGVPYPVDTQRLEAALKNVKDPEILNMAQAYEKQAWGPQRMDQDFQKVVNWAHRHGVKLHLGEFGVYSAAANQNERMAWFADISGLIENAEFGWSLWGYEDAFGLQRRIRPDGSVQIDESVAKALRLLE